MLTKIKTRLLWLLLQCHTEAADVWSAVAAFVWCYTLAGPGDYFSENSKLAVFSGMGERVWMPLFLTLCLAHIVTLLLTIPPSKDGEVDCATPADCLWARTRVWVCLFACGVWAACGSMCAIGGATLGAGMCLALSGFPFWSAVRQLTALYRPEARKQVRREDRRGAMLEKSA